MKKVQAFVISLMALGCTLAHGREYSQGIDWSKPQSHSTRQSLLSEMSLFHLCREYILAQIYDASEEAKRSTSAEMRRRSISPEKCASNAQLNALLQDIEKLNFFANKAALARDEYNQLRRQQRRLESADRMLKILQEYRQENDRIWAKAAKELNEQNIKRIRKQEEKKKNDELIYNLREQIRKISPNHCLLTKAVGCP